MVDEVGNFSIVILWVIGPLFFHSILYSLVSREDLKNILANTAGTRDGRGMAEGRAVQALPIQLVSMDDHAVEAQRDGEAKARQSGAGTEISGEDAFQVRLGTQVV